MIFSIALSFGSGQYCVGKQWRSTGIFLLKMFFVEVFWPIPEDEYSKGFVSGQCHSASEARFDGCHLTHHDTSTIFVAEQKSMALDMAQSPKSQFILQLLEIL